LGIGALDKLDSGSILSKDVRDINGRLLLTKGKAVDREQIRLLRMWGVAEVDVQGSIESAAAPLDEENPKRKAIEGALVRMLQYVDTEHPAIVTIIKSAIEYRFQHNLMLGFEDPKRLSPDFRFDLHRAVQTQIRFSEIQLPESPQIVTQFNEVAANPRSSGNDLAEVVNTSPSLAAVLLKIANSAIFGFPSRIDTVSRAVALLGTREVGSLIMGISVMRLFNNIPKDLVDMSTFMRHSLACGLLSRIMAARLNRPNTEQMFVAGLLHDLGRLVWYRYFPDQARLCLELARKTGLSLYEIETECSGINHEQIAAQLLDKWKLSETLTDCIVYHHHPSRCPDPTGPGIVQVADLAVNALGLGHSGEHAVPHFDARVWNRLNLSPNALRIAMGQTIEQMDIMGTPHWGLTE